MLSNLPKREHVKQLLKTIQKNRRPSEQPDSARTLTPRKIDYYSPEKQQLVKEQKPWRYYANTREPAALIHPSVSYTRSRFLSERDKYKCSFTDRTFTKDPVEHHMHTDQPSVDRFTSQRIRSRIAKMKEIQLDIKYSPYKFGRIPLDQQLDKFAYWDPQQRSRLQPQFVTALPKVLHESKGDTMIAYRSFRSGRK